MEDSDYRTISQDELLALAEASQAFEGLRFSPEVAFDDLDLTNGRFTRCLFQSPIVRTANFTEAKFKDCRFTPSRFASCKFVDAQFENCAFFDPEQKLGCTFAFCEIRAVDVTKCNFSLNSFERCDLYNLAAIECGFRGAKFHGSSFDRAISRKVVLTKAKFDKCNFSFADLSGLSLRTAEFLSCKFSDAALFDVDLTDAVMTGSTFDGAEWNRAKLGGADLRGASLSGLNLAVLAEYAGLMISASEQSALLTLLGIEVSPD